MDYKSEKTLNHLSKIIFIIYIGLLVWVVMFKCNLIDSIYRAYAFMSEQTLKERFLRFIVPFKDYTEAFFQNQIKILVKDDILTEGVVSNSNVEVELEKVKRQVIQCDITIAEGNSGGALLNENGEIVGLTTFRLKDASNNVIYGIAYCIPANTILEYIKN
ncbi:MAG: trypsin-like peptidase domain-containing protein [Clostridia bacterium]|nr:trypsin-like peptidase domain-containing protein [Clostridia bacterium]